jgi:hypothetical protein
MMYRCFVQQSFPRLIVLWLSYKPLARCVLCHAVEADLARASPPHSCLSSAAGCVQKATADMQHAAVVVVVVVLLLFGLFIKK